MSCAGGIITAAVRHLMAAGVTGEALLAAIAEMEASGGSKDPAAERRRARDRAYQAERRRQKSAESADSDDLGDVKEIPPDPHKKIPPLVSPKGDVPPTKNHVIVPSWVPAEHWRAFVEMRRLKKKPVTPFIAERLFRKLRKFADAGWNIADILERSTVNCWQDIFEPEEGKGVRRANDNQEAWTPERKAAYAAKLEHRESTGPPRQIGAITGDLLRSVGGSGG